MITSEKINIYRKYKGNIDGWARRNKRSEHLLMQDEDWYTIDNFIQDLQLIKSNLASAYYKEQTYARLKEQCEDEHVIKAIEKLVK
ncbi:MAG: hypothetical protein AAGI49_12660 [Bacteroidota bacterium]